MAEHLPKASLPGGGGPSARSAPDGLDVSVSAREQEEIFMTDDAAARIRIGALTDARWREMFDADTTVSRRPRTIGACSGVSETLQLARYARHADDEGSKQSRGEKMLPDVVSELRDILARDTALKTNMPLRTALEAALTFDGAPTASQIALLNALSGHLRDEYIHLMRSSLVRHFTSTPSLVGFEEGLEQLASHARGIGWSDEGLGQIWNEIALDAADPLSRVERLCDAISSTDRTFTCTIPIDVGDVESSTFHLPEHGLEVTADNSALQIRLRVTAKDPWGAARQALHRAAAAVGAPNVFQQRPSRLASTYVNVTDDSGSVSVNAEEHLRRDHHNPWKDQLRTMVQVAARAGTSDSDTLWDAIRNHHRALATSDVEAAFVLLWSALERLCSNPDRPEPILANTADLVSAAMALSKIRREVGQFADAVTARMSAIGLLESMEVHSLADGLVRPERVVVSHKAVLSAMIGDVDHAKAFCGVFYDDVLLTQWFFRLRRQFASQRGVASVEALSGRVSSVISESRTRTQWQMKRLYRARNGLAHGASRPLWLADLGRHANYLLTNALAICVTYSSRNPGSARSILDTRQGWLDAYLSLARASEPRALSVDGMLKPSQLFAR